MKIMIILIKMKSIIIQIFMANLRKYSIKANKELGFYYF